MQKALFGGFWPVRITGLLNQLPNTGTQEDGLQGAETSSPNCRGNYEVDGGREEGHGTGNE